MAPAPGGGRIRLLAILIAATALGPISFNISIPSMPGLQAAFDADYGTVQLVLTFYLIGLAGAQLVHGPLSDRFGRRPVMLGGLALHLTGSAACLIAPTIGLLVAGRVIQAVGSCVGLVVGRAIVRDIFDRERTASVLATIIMAMMVAPMFSPTIGGYLDVWFGWRAPFASILAVGGLLMAATYLWLPETLARPTAGAGVGVILTDFVALFRRRLFCGYAFQVACASLTFMAFLGGAPYAIVEILGRPASDYGLFFIPVAASYMIGNFIASRQSARIGIDRMITAGTLITIAGATLGVGLHLASGPSTFAVFGPTAVIAFGQGFCIPNGLAGAVSVDPRLAGSAAGLSGFLQTALGAVGSWLVGSLMADSAGPMAFVMLAGTLMAVAAHAWGVLMARPAPEVAAPTAGPSA